MKLDRNELLKQITVKQEVFEVPSWNNAEVTMRQLTIAETTKYIQMIKDKKPIEDAIKYACQCSMIEPKFFTDEELKNLNQEGIMGINEIFANIPTIGKSKEEKEKILNQLNDTSKTPVKELTKEEEEKK